MMQMRGAVRRCTQTQEPTVVCAGPDAYGVPGVYAYKLYDFFNIY